MHLSIRTTNAATKTTREIDIDLGDDFALETAPSVTAVAAPSIEAQQPVAAARFIGLGHDYQPAGDIAAAPYVLDTSTGLIWARTLTQNGEAKRLDHKQATAAVADLGEGWRLPTRAELLTLVDDTRHEPAIDITAFPDTQSGWYWTSTPAAWDPSSVAWVVYFNGGLALTFGRDYGAFVRAVRVASPAGQ